MSESDLVEGLQSKDFKIFEKIVNQYQSMVVNLCFKMTASHEDAEDLAQEVFIKIWDKADQFRGDSSLQTWIYRVAINISLNHNRKNKIKSLFQSIEATFNIGHHDNPQKKLEDSEKQNVVITAIKSLPENQQIALSLRTYKELSYEEISEVMNVSISSVESLIFRAKRNLKKKLVKYYKSS